MKPPCKTFLPYKKFHQVPPKSSASDKALHHIFSQQCRPKQLRYNVFIDNCLKCSEKTKTFMI